MALRKQEVYMKIGLMGLTFVSSNKGCMALAHSFIEILTELGYKNSEYIVFATEEYDTNVLSSVIEHYQVVPFKIKKLQTVITAFKKMKECDVVFDFTEGDSFSDIYGTKRMCKVSLMKMMAIWAHSKLVLAPQTYGPYNKAFSRKLAKYIFKHSYRVYSRDQKSADLVKMLTGSDISSYTDIAFGLAPSSNLVFVETGNKNAGINISALLWNGGYTSKNQFGLKVDYKKYCCKCIEALRERGYKVHLIPHVYGEEMPDIENDYLACREIQKKYPDCIVADMYINPEEIKSYIAHMQIFIGARMHSTVAAFSTGVVTIPFSYSKKFDGLYGSVGYSYIIDGRKENTDSAVNKTVEYIDHSEQLKVAQKKSMALINEKLYDFKAEVLRTLQ